MLREIEGGEVNLPELFTTHLQSMRAVLTGGPTVSTDDPESHLRYTFSTQSNPAVELILPRDFLPNLNGGRTVDTLDTIEELLDDLHRREDISHHLQLGQDPRHAMGIDFFISNWDLLSGLIHPHAQEYVKPRAFVEVRIATNIGPIDFVGLAADASIFLAEFGRTGGKHRQLKDYLDLVCELYPEHKDHIHSFVVKPLHESSEEAMRLRVSNHIKSFSIGLPANGGRPQQLNQGTLFSQ